MGKYGLAMFWGGGGGNRIALLMAILLISVGPSRSIVKISDRFFSALSLNFMNIKYYRSAQKDFNIQLLCSPDMKCCLCLFCFTASHSHSISMQQNLVIRKTKIKQ